MLVKLTRGLHNVRRKFKYLVFFSFRFSIQIIADKQYMRLWVQTISRPWEKHFFVVRTQTKQVLKKRTCILLSARPSIFADFLSANLLYHKIGQILTFYLQKLWSKMTERTVNNEGNPSFIFVLQFVKN